MPAECRAARDLYFCLYRTAPVLVYNRDAVRADLIGGGFGSGGLKESETNFHS